MAGPRNLRGECGVYMHMRWLLVVSLVAVVAGACTGNSNHPRGDATAIRTCERTNFSHVEDFGVTFTASGHPKLVAAFGATGRVLNTWDPTNTEHPTFSLWRGEADGRTMAACFFDGSFRTADGRSFARALIESDGTRYRLIVADTRSVLVISRPPRA